MRRTHAAALTLACAVVACGERPRVRDAAPTQQATPASVPGADTSWALFPEQLHWQVQREISPVDGAVRLELRREGRDTILGAVRPGGPLELSIRCYGGRPSIRVLAMADASSEDEIPLKYRLDTGSVHAEAWPALTLGMGGEAPEPRALLRALLQADTMHIERVFASGSMVSAISVHELREYRADIGRACGAKAASANARRLRVWPLPS